ncbi:Hypothetical protein LUCI_4260 [Lucifera butyrica]|uniref:Uncharacterized protein n=1 Tax=Lucifera butyrica TaxID=1351585 RepID=A0A498RBU4_9FIRM|nr:Hypothetical protein LUCI_4260 [Lucifera butyrica]
MDRTGKTLQGHRDFWFSFYYQGYYFSVGYFAFPGKTEYMRNLAMKYAS